MLTVCSVKDVGDYSGDADGACRLGTQRFRKTSDSRAIRAADLGYIEN
jgi:hypothetical protein